MKGTILLIIATIFLLLLLIITLIIIINKVKEHKEKVDEHLKGWKQRTQEQQMYEDGIRNW